MSKVISFGKSLRKLNRLSSEKFTTRRQDQHNIEALMKMFKSYYHKNILKTAGLL